MWTERQGPGKGFFGAVEVGAEEDVAGIVQPEVVRLVAQVEGDQDALVFSKAGSMGTRASAGQCR